MEINIQIHSVYHSALLCGTASPLIHFVILPCSFLLSFLLHSAEQDLLGKMRQPVNCDPCRSSRSETFQNQTHLPYHVANLQACPEKVPQPKSESFLKGPNKVRHGGEETNDRGTEQDCGHELSMLKARSPPYSIGLGRCTGSLGTASLG